MRKLSLLALPALALFAGCAEQVAAPTARVYAVDMRGGAQVCTVPNSVKPDGTTAVPVAMTVSNDGGWCGITVDRAAYAAGLVETRPTHGRLHIHTVGDKTRIDYIPDVGFTGTDRFVVKLISGDARIQGNVTVTAAPRPVAPAAHPSSQPPAQATPSRPQQRR